jgi:hypothetical protein
VADEDGKVPANRHVPNGVEPLLCEKRPAAGVPDVSFGASSG